MAFTEVSTLSFLCSQIEEMCTGFLLYGVRVAQSNHDEWRNGEKG